MADPNVTVTATQADWDAVAAERAGGTPAPVINESPDNAAETETADKPLDAAPGAGAKPEPKKEVDPYAGYAPDVQARLKKADEVLAQFPQLVNELKEAKGRIGALQSDWAKSRQQPAAGDAPNQKQIQEAAKDPEKWESLKKDFPEWGEGIQAFVESRLKALPGGLTTEQVEQMVASRVDALTAQFERVLINTKYPAWEEVVKQDDFTAWFNAQPADVQALQHSTKGSDAVKILDLFHEAKEKPVAKVKDTRRQKLEAAVTSKPGAPVATKTFEDMTPKEQWNYLAEERARQDALAAA